MTPLSLADQVAAHRRHRVRALDIIAVRMQMKRDHLFALSERRLQSGHSVFGDQMFRTTQDGAIANTDEEIADAVNYIVGMLERAERAQAQGARIKLGIE